MYGTSLSCAPLSSVVPHHHLHPSFLPVVTWTCIMIFQIQAFPSKVCSWVIQLIWTDPCWLYLENQLHTITEECCLLAIIKKKNVGNKNNALKNNVWSPHFLHWSPLSAVGDLSGTLSVRYTGEQVQTQWRSWLKRPSSRLLKDKASFKAPEEALSSTWVAERCLNG